MKKYQGGSLIFKISGENDLMKQSMLFILLVMFLASCSHNNAFNEVLIIQDGAPENDIAVMRDDLIYCPLDTARLGISVYNIDVREKGNKPQKDIFHYTHSFFDQLNIFKHLNYKEDSNTITIIEYTLEKFPDSSGSNTHVYIKAIDSPSDSTGPKCIFIKAVNKSVNSTLQYLKNNKYHVKNWDIGENTHSVETNLDRNTFLKFFPKFKGSFYQRTPRSIIINNRLDPAKKTFYEKIRIL
jgi:hypothetical protein